jgi:hypothetical protein
VGRKRERERIRDGEREPKMREGERDRAAKKRNA